MKDRVAAYGSYKGTNTDYRIVWTNSTLVAYEAILHREFYSEQNVAYLDLEATLHNHTNPHVLSCIQILCGNTVVIMYGPNCKHALWLLIAALKTHVS